MVDMLRSLMSCVTNKKKVKLKGLQKTLARILAYKNGRDNLTKFKPNVINYSIEVLIEELQIGFVRIHTQSDYKLGSF